MSDAPTQNAPPKYTPPPHEQLTSWGVRYVIAMRWSMDTATIKPMDWPSRIVAALGAAVTKGHFSAMTAETARKLNVATLTARTVEDLRAIEHEIVEARAFRDFRAHVRSEATVLEAFARAERKAERAADDVLRAERQRQPLSPYTAGRDATAHPTATAMTEETTP